MIDRRGGKAHPRCCRNWTWLASLLLVLFAAFCPANVAAEPVRLDQNFDHVVLGKSLEFHEDTSGQMDLAAAQSAHFHEITQDKPSFGYTTSAFWLRFSMENNTEKNFPVILELVSLVDSIEVYTERNGKWQVKKTGRASALSTRDIPHRNFLFEMEASPGPSVVYLRFKSEGSMLLPLTLWRPSAFHLKNDTEQLIFGAYFGILIALLLYNLFLFFAVQDRSYLFYVLYVLSFGIVQAGIWGFLQQAFGDYPAFAARLLPSAIGATVFFGVAFSADFLTIKTGMRLALFRIIQAISILVVLLAFLAPYRVSVQVGVFTGIITVVVLTVVAFIAARTFKPARYFLLAFAALFVGMAVIMLRNLGFFSFTIISSYSGQIGSVMEVILLSLALADRINTLKAEKQETQRLALETQRNMATSFSRFVPREFLDLLQVTDVTAVKPGDAVQRELTVLFADIRGFTTISEKMNPRENFQFINAFIRRVGPVIREHGGFIDKFIGDAVMALFVDAEKAALAAVATLETLDAYNDERMQQGFIPIVLGIGIHTGHLMLGIIGEEKRIEGTVISDAVNTAARIESLTRQYGAEILVSEAVAQKTQLATKYIGEVQLRGKSDSIRIFSIPRHGIGDVTQNKPV